MKAIPLNWDVKRLTTIEPIISSVSEESSTTQNIIEKETDSMVSSSSAAPIDSSTQKSVELTTEGIRSSETPLTETTTARMDSSTLMPEIRKKPAEDIRTTEIDSIQTTSSVLPSESTTLNF